MKNTIRIAAVLLAVVVFGGCVTKQQYAELELKYKRSQDELTYMTAENQNCQDAKKSLAAQLAALTAEAEKLTADTVRLYRKARTCEMEYEKAQKEYDELLRNFAEVSSSNQSTIDGRAAHQRDAVYLGPEGRRSESPEGEGDERAEGFRGQRSQRV